MDIDVVVRAQGGDQAAFARIVARYQAELFSIAVLVTRDRSLAEDAAQSAWAIAWRKLHTIRSPERLRPWLVSVTASSTPGRVASSSARAEISVRGMATFSRISMGAVWWLIPIVKSGMGKKFCVALILRVMHPFIK